MSASSKVHLIPHDTPGLKPTVPEVSSSASVDPEPSLADTDDLMETFLEAGKSCRAVGSFVICNQSAVLKSRLEHVQQERQGKRRGNGLASSTEVAKRACIESHSGYPTAAERELGIQATRTKRMAQLLHKLERTHAEFAAELHVVLKNHKEPPKNSCR